MPVWMSIMSLPIGKASFSEEQLADNFQTLMGAVVKEIYAMYLSGMGTIAISNVLNDRGLKTSRGNPWGTNSILEIISNEKYTGDSLMGKHVRVNGVHMDNTGGRYSKQYMVENTHEAIVSHETFDKAQAERARRKNPKMVGVQHDPLT